MTTYERRALRSGPKTRTSRRLRYYAAIQRPEARVPGRHKLDAFLVMATVEMLEMLRVYRCADCEDAHYALVDLIKSHAPAVTS